MPYQENICLSQNWYIRTKVAQALRCHDEEGTIKGPLLYIGDTKRIEELVLVFELFSLQTDVASVRLRARFSCVDDLSNKYHIISVYQTERLLDGSKKQIVEATWTPKNRLNLHLVTATLSDAFAPLISANPKYGGKLPEIVGQLHEYD